MIVTFRPNKGSRCRHVTFLQRWMIVVCLIRSICTATLNGQIGEKLGPYEDDSPLELLLEPNFSEIIESLDNNDPTPGFDFSAEQGLGGSTEMESKKSTSLKDSIMGVKFEQGGFKNGGKPSEYEYKGQLDGVSRFEREVDVNRGLDSTLTEAVLFNQSESDTTFKSSTAELSEQESLNESKASVGGLDGKSQLQISDASSNNPDTNIKNPYLSPKEAQIENTDHPDKQLDRDSVNSKVDEIQIKNLSSSKEEFGETIVLTDPPHSSYLTEEKKLARGGFQSDSSPGKGDFEIQFDGAPGLHSGGDSVWDTDLTVGDTPERLVQSMPEESQIIFVSSKKAGQPKDEYQGHFEDPSKGLDSFPKDSIRLNQHFKQAVEIKSSLDGYASTVDTDTSKSPALNSAGESSEQKHILDEKGPDEKLEGLEPFSMKGLGLIREWAKEEEEEQQHSTATRIEGTQSSSKLTGVSTVYHSSSGTTSLSVATITFDASHTKISSCIYGCTTLTVSQTKQANFDSTVITVLPVTLPCSLLVCPPCGCTTKVVSVTGCPIITTTTLNPSFVTVTADTTITLITVTETVTSCTATTTITIQAGITDNDDSCDADVSKTTVTKYSTVRITTVTKYSTTKIPRTAVAAGSSSPVIEPDCGCPPGYDYTSISSQPSGGCDCKQKNPEKLLGYAYQPEWEKVPEWKVKGCRQCDSEEISPGYSCRGAGNCAPNQILAGSNNYPLHVFKAEKIPPTTSCDIQNFPLETQTIPGPVCSTFIVCNPQQFSCPTQVTGALQLSKFVEKWDMVPGKIPGGLPHGGGGYSGESSTQFDENYLGYDGNLYGIGSGKIQGSNNTSSYIKTGYTSLASSTFVGGPSITGSKDDLRLSKAASRNAATKFSWNITLPAIILITLGILFL